MNLLHSFSRLCMPSFEEYEASDPQDPNSYRREKIAMAMEKMQKDPVAVMREVLADLSSRKEWALPELSDAFDQKLGERIPGLSALCLSELRVQGLVQSFYKAVLDGVYLATEYHSPLDVPEELWEEHEPVPFFRMLKLGEKPPALNTLSIPDEIELALRKHMRNVRLSANLYC